MEEDDDDDDDDDVKLSNQLINHVKVKGKATTVQDWTGSDSSGRLSLPDFMTFVKGRW
jgi:hypothetical protein